MEATAVPATPRTELSPRRKAFVGGAGLLLVLFLGFSVFFYLNFRTIEVQGESMAPTFHTGKRLLVTKAYWLVGPIRENDIIVLESPKDGDTVIKRVVHLEGEQVDLLNSPRSWSLAEGQFTVPADHYFVIGDNKPVSEDSRDYGAVPEANIIGKVVYLDF